MIMFCYVLFLPFFLVKNEVGLLDYSRSCVCNLVHICTLVHSSFYLSGSFFTKLVVNIVPIGDISVPHIF